MDPMMIVAGLVIGAIIGIVILKFMFGAKQEKNAPVCEQSTHAAGHRKPTEEELARLRELYRIGEKIQSIKEYRAITGAGLKEAKDFCDSNFTQEVVTPFQKGFANAVNTMAKEQQQEQGLEEIRALMQAGEKIQAIKRYREVFGVGLAEARDAVERL